MTRNVALRGTIRRLQRKQQRPQWWRPVHSWIACLLLFASMLILFSTPSPTSKDTTDARKTLDAEPAVKAAISNPVLSTAPVLVQCTITTPHSTLPASTAANGHIHITVRPDLAPKASAAFLDLVKSQYYDGVYIHRVIKGFVAQFGIHPNWKGEKPPKPKDIAPDPVLPGKSLSNVRGTVSFSGGNMRLGQVFINLGGNSRLDKENGDDGSTRPFATVSTDGMVIADGLFTGYKEGQGQVKTVKEGDGAVASKFPNMSKIEECRLVSSFHRR